MSILSLIKSITGVAPRKVAIDTILSTGNLTGSEGDTYLARVSILYDNVKAFVVDGLTFEEAGQIISQFSELAVSLANDLSKPGVYKKELVMESIKYILDIIWPKLPIPWWVNWLPIDLKAIVLVFASGLVEDAYYRINPQPAPTVTPVNPK